MKLKISIHGWGAEIAVNEISSDVYEYIQDNFGGSLDDYAEALDNGDVPDEYSMVDGTRSGFVSDGDYHAYGPSLGAYITVEDEETGKVYVDAEECSEFAGDEPSSRESPRADAKDDQHFAMGQSEEKGYWTEWHIETKGKKFSKKKLKVVYETLWFNNEALSTVTGIEYDGESYDLDFDELSTDGKSFNLDMD